MEEKFGLKPNDIDNVATVFSDGVAAGDRLTVKNKQGERFDVTVNTGIPYAHKCALTAIAKGESIIKYGQEIGVATSDIKAGDHVHVHNLESRRGRGDRQW